MVIIRMNRPMGPVPNPHLSLSLHLHNKQTPTLQFNNSTTPQLHNPAPSAMDHRPIQNPYLTPKTNRMRKDWWKWGDPTVYEHVNNYPKLKDIFRDRFGMELREDFHPPVDFDIPSLSPADEELLRRAFDGLPDTRLDFSRDTRLAKSLGKSYHDVIRIFCHHELRVPHVVVFPENHEEVLSVVLAAQEHGIELVAVGGGSNVVGGLTIEPGRGARKIAYLDMGRMDRLLSIDEENHLAVFQAGVMGPHLEEQLKPYGLTMGHFPQSFEYSSLGGWVVTRSAGQESTYYGKIEDMVVSLKVATPVGSLTTPAFDRDAEGVNLTPLFIGSEGVFGVVTEVTVRLHRKPASNRWVLALFPTFQDGVNCMKNVIHDGIRPSVCRLSDAPETYFYSQLKPESTGLAASLKSAVQQAYLNLKGIEEPNIMMLRFEEVSASRLSDVLHVRRLVGKHGGALIPSSLAKNWEATRFHTPYLRDTMMEHRVFIDTMETVVPWHRVMDMHRAVTANLGQCPEFHGEKGIVMGHISHIYPHGACMYFILICPMDRGSEVEQWEAIKQVMNDTFTANGGSISHHHSVGLDHREHYLRRQDQLALDVLRAVKDKLDPNRVMNPGKLFDGPRG